MGLIFMGFSVLNLIQGKQLLRILYMGLLLGQFNSWGSQIIWLRLDSSGLASEMLNNFEAVLTSRRCLRPKVQTLSPSTHY